MNKKKYIEVTFYLEVDSNDVDLNIKSIGALNNYILSAPIEFLNNHRPNIIDVVSTTDINPFILKKSNAKEYPITVAMDQIAALLITWEYEGQHTKRHSYGKTLHLDAESMQKYKDTIIPNSRESYVSQIKYYVMKEELVDITNKELIQQLTTEKTLIFKKSLPNFH